MKTKMKDFDTFGVMIDMSRNAVMTMDALKRFLPLLSKMGYNCVMLYTEDTYEVENEPYFGYMRGRYSKEELKEIDALAATLGMSVIPCIQTLAHLNGVFRWKNFPKDCNDILLTDDERTYELIDHMFASLSECLTSRKIHIGMDEAHMLGRGVHLDRHGYETVDTIMKRHLARVCEIAKKYDYELMIWSDMFFRPWNNGSYYVSKTDIPQGYVDALPEKVIPVYWDYYHTKEVSYSDMMENHKQLSENTWFAGGAWGWRGLIPYNGYTLQSMLPAIEACKKQGVRNVVFTMWGDDGAECSHFSQLPSLFYLAEVAKGNDDAEQIKKKFKNFVGIDFDSFMLMDEPNNVIIQNDVPRNPSKYMLYSDYFNGFLDCTVTGIENAYYEKLAPKLHAIAKSSRKYGYVFASAAALCDVLAVKYELGLKTRTAYQAGDRDALSRLATCEYAEAEKRIKAFIRVFRKQWMLDNKPHGFDVQEHRLGALLLRTQSCRERLLDYVAGRIESIGELEEELLQYAPNGKMMTLNKAPLYSTVNIIYFGSVL